jgi:RimJ/RimL family protein N-acetyltransferase
MASLMPISDGVVTIRPPAAGDAGILIAGRDEEFHRWLGPGAETPAPVGVIVVQDHLVGWIDYDVEHDWLEPGEVNVGYNVFPPQRGNGYATRAVELLMQHLEADTPYDTATLLIYPQNGPSLAVAARTRFKPSGEVDGSRYFKRPIRSV